MFDRLSELERIQGCQLCGKGRLEGIREIRRFDNSLIRGFGGIIAFNGLGGNPLFGNELNGGAEEVVKEPPFLGIELVE